MGWAFAETLGGWAAALIALIFVVAAFGLLCRVLWWALVGD